MKMAKVKWNQICLPKAKGGAGVVDIRVKNKSLLAKWCWRFAVDREALWRKIIAAKYGNSYATLAFQNEQFKRYVSGLQGYCGESERFDSSKMGRD